MHITIERGSKKEKQNEKTTQTDVSVFMPYVKITFTMVQDAKKFNSSFYIFMSQVIAHKIKTKEKKLIFYGTKVSLQVLCENIVNI